MHVLVIHPGSELYGSDRMVVESVRGLVESGAVVDVFLPDVGPLGAEITAAGGRCAIVPMPVLRKSALRPRGMFALIRTALWVAPGAHRLLRDIRPDVVYVSTLILPFWVLLARLHRIPTICHVHEAERYPSRLVELGLVGPLRAASRVLVNSSYSASVLGTVLPSLVRRTHVIINGVVGPSDPAPLRLGIAPPMRLLYIGRLSPRKGPDVAMEALRLLRTSGLDVTLTVLGSVFPGYEWFEQELRDRFAAEIVSGSIALRGFVPDVWQVMDESDVVVVPSTLPEPFGNTAVESRLAGRPVIVSALGGLPEAIEGGHAGVAVTPGDPQALAEAVLALVADWPRVASISRHDQADARCRFAPERYRHEVSEAVRLVAGRLTGSTLGAP